MEYRDRERRKGGWRGRAWGLPAGAVLVLGGVVVGMAAPAAGQWTNRYAKLEGYGHHVYVEGFELPIFSNGPTDPAPSPDGAAIAFVARGWLWLLDPETGVARRITTGPGMDSRPAWSPDGSRLAFLRDDGSELAIWSLDLDSGAEQELFADGSIVLDPAFDPDGGALYFSAGTAGDLDVWRLALETGEPARITTHRGLEVRPQPLGGGRLAYLAKGRSSPDRLVVREADGVETTLRAQSIASQAHPGASPDGSAIAVNWPGERGYRLVLLDAGGGPESDEIELAAARGLPLSPAFEAGGGAVIYAEAAAPDPPDPDRLRGEVRQSGRFRLMRVPVAGGPAAELAIRAWDYGAPTARIRITTTMRGSAEPVAARLAVRGPGGHPAVADGARPYFDGTHGTVFFHSPGVVEIETPATPAGDVQVLAARGFASAPAMATMRFESPAAGGVGGEVQIEFEPLWDSRAAGYRSADHHFHLNYGGPVRLSPDDLVLQLEAEDLDFGTPLMANLHHRLNDTEFFADRRVAATPAVLFGQEIRSHFLGHLGLIGVESAFWPWFWGPGYPVYAADDRPNADALAHARRQGGVSAYMHPVSHPDPFGSEAGLRAIPLSLIPDAVLGDLDTLEIACLWTSEVGTAAVWSRLLNIGVPVAASAGTDVMLDYYRTMAVGATRVYVHAPGPFRADEYFDALRAGRSFVTTGPLLDFRVGDERPGGVLRSGGETGWSLALASPGPVERVEILVNGEPVASLPGLDEAGRRNLSGTVPLPEGGWVAARALGGEEAWPGMNGSIYARTSPVWIGERGATEPGAARAAAADLLRALEVAEARLDERYGDLPMPRIRARFAEARNVLLPIAGPDVAEESR